MQLPPGTLAEPRCEQLPGSCRPAPSPAAHLHFLVADVHIHDARCSVDGDVVSVLQAAPGSLISPHMRPSGMAPHGGPTAGEGGGGLRVAVSGQAAASRLLCDHRAPQIRRTVRLCPQLPAGSSVGACKSGHHRRRQVAQCPAWTPPPPPKPAAAAAEGSSGSQQQEGQRRRHAQGWRRTWIRAMGPPTCASGVTWPITNPWLPPLKRPSVIRAHSCSRRGGAGQGGAEGSRHNRARVLGGGGWGGGWVGKGGEGEAP